MNKIITYKTVAVLIPAYKAELNHYEKASLIQCLKILHKYDIYLCCSKNLNLSIYKEIFNSYDLELKCEFFEPFYFQNIEGYNKLMLSINFYKRFINYNYTLIYQLDAWIFKDDLLNWCNLNFDYIGGPWIDNYWSDFYSKHLTITRTLMWKLGYKRFKQVGNGGLSLRKTKSMIINLKLFKAKALNFKLNEDIFFSFYISSYNLLFKIPSLKEAIKFSFDECPARALQINQGNLPMGCHAFHKHMAFWKNYIHINV